MTSDFDLDFCINQAARAIAAADALLIGAGAGMGVDSGLPDFRGDHGFWNAYPPFRGQSFAQVANPRTFHEDPALGWGFYGHRLNLYRSTVPHDGFNIIRRWGEEIVGDYFVCTSNVDGHFQKSGFAADNVLEVHGSIHYLQCFRNCTGQIWSAEEINVEVDENSFRALGELPCCINCSLMARPNILMFGDMGWIPSRCTEQERRYEKWLSRHSSGRVVAIEFGCGTAIPTIRFECQRRSQTLIRINPRDYDGPAHAIPIPLNALAAILKIDAALASL